MLTNDYTLKFVLNIIEKYKKKVPENSLIHGSMQEATRNLNIKELATYFKEKQLELKQQVPSALILDIF